MTGNYQGKVTLDSQRTVLAVARNGASAFRMLEVIKLFDNDARLNVRITVGPESLYGYGVTQLLRSARIRPLPWKHAKNSTFDLVLSGSANACLNDIHGPLVLFPHGAGYHKRHPGVASGNQVFELTDEQLLHNGSVIASRHLLAGRDSMHRLRRDCEPAAKRAIIAGDPIAQQLRDHLPLRDTYRAELGVRPGQRLVTVSSTWGPGSLAGQRLDLLQRLVAELPADEYRVAATFHHNVSIQDGHRELERILQAATSSGLILLPPEMSWQPAVIAADCVIGDHGSTTFYAADVAPTAIAAHAPAEYPADSPLSELIATLPYIDQHQPLPDQVAALATAPWSTMVDTIINSSIERHVDAASVFRSTMYELMRLDEPTAPAFLPLDNARPAPTTVTAFLVHAIVTGGSSAVTLTRYPAAIAAMGPNRHLVVRTDDGDPRRAQTAAALVAVNVELHLAGLLKRFPSCRVAAKPLESGKVELRVRDGTEFLVSPDRVADSDVASFAASAYLALANTGKQPAEGIVVNCGDRTIAMTFRKSSAA